MDKEIADRHDEVEFCLELKALLEKYNASIEFEVGSGSDTHGLYDEKMVAYFKTTDSLKHLSNGWGVSKNDL